MCIDKCVETVKKQVLRSKMFFVVEKFGIVYCSCGSWITMAAVLVGLWTQEKYCQTNYSETMTEMVESQNGEYLNDAAMVSDYQWSVKKWNYKIHLVFGIWSTMIASNVSVHSFHIHGAVPKALPSHRLFPYPTRLVVLLPVDHDNSMYWCFRKQ